MGTYIDKKGCLCVRDFDHKKEKKPPNQERTIRPDYITCIKQTYNEKKSWCGRDTSMGFAFQNIQSAQDAVAQGSRLTICHECWAKIQDKLDEGIENIKAFRIG